MVSDIVFGVGLDSTEKAAATGAETNKSTLKRGDAMVVLIVGEGSFASRLRF